jgi:signal transduction histidine kinase
LRKALFGPQKWQGAAGRINGRFAVSVADTGPGMPEHERSRMFEQFHQIDGSNSKVKGGTGLGLAIAKQIVEMHGGRRIGSMTSASCACRR